MLKKQQLRLRPSWTRRAFDWSWQLWHLLSINIHMFIIASQCVLAICRVSKLNITRSVVDSKETNLLIVSMLSPWPLPDMALQNLWTSSERVRLAKLQILETSWKSLRTHLQARLLFLRKPCSPGLFWPGCDVHWPCDFRGAKSSVTSILISLIYTDLISVYFLCQTHFCNLLFKVTPTQVLSGTLWYSLNAEIL